MHPPYTPDLAHRDDYLLFATLMTGSPAKATSSLRKCVEIIEKIWTEVISREGNYITEINDVCLKNVLS